MDKQEEIYETAKDLGVPGPLARRLATLAMGYEEAIIAEIDRLADIPTKEGESKYIQLKRAIGELIREAHRQRKSEEVEKQHAAVVQEYERGRAKGIIPTPKQLEAMIVELYENDGIMECTPRNVPKGLREDPIALKAKLLEWGMIGTTLVHEIVGVESSAEEKVEAEADEDFGIPF